MHDLGSRRGARDIFTPHRVLVQSVCPWHDRLHARE